MDWPQWPSHKGTLPSWMFCRGEFWEKMLDGSGHVIKPGGKQHAVWRNGFSMHSQFSLWKREGKLYSSKKLCWLVALPMVSICGVRALHGWTTCIMGNQLPCHTLPKASPAWQRGTIAIDSFLEICHAKMQATTMAWSNQTSATKLARRRANFCYVLCDRIFRWPMSL